MSGEFTPEELPEWAERLTEEQEAALRVLCSRFGVDYDPAHYYVWPPDSLLTPGWAEGWLGGYEIQQQRPTIYVGVSPEGRAHS